jgi:drug/metabolite transporter (DMT)-like permease
MVAAACVLAWSFAVGLFISTTLSMPGTGARLEEAIGDEKWPVDSATRSRFAVGVAASLWQRGRQVRSSVHGYRQQPRALLACVVFLVAILGFFSGSVIAVGPLLSMPMAAWALEMMHVSWTRTLAAGVAVVGISGAFFSVGLSRLSDAGIATGLSLCAISCLQALLVWMAPRLQRQVRKALGAQ